MHSLFPVLINLKFLLRNLIIIILLLVSTANSQWVNKQSNLPQWNPDGSAIDAIDSLTAVIAIPIDGGTKMCLYLTNDGGLKWKIVELDQPRWIIDVSMVDSSHIWVVTANPHGTSPLPNTIMATTDAGNTWNIQYEIPDSITYFMNYIEMFDLSNGVAMGDAPYPFLDKPAPFFRTTDGGLNWISVSDSFINRSVDNSWRNIDFINPDTGYFKPASSNQHRIFRTTDGAKNWTQLPEAYGLTNALKFHSHTYGVAQMLSTNPWHGEYIIRTTDAGNSWDSAFISMDMYTMGADFEFIKNDPSKIWYTGIDKLYFSADSGKSWTKDTLTFIRAQDLAVVDGNVCWFLCETVYRNLNADHITSVQQNPGIVKDLHLYQNYPNPFNPITNIEFEIKERLFVSLKVYDILGKEISVLVNEEKNPGLYSIKFNGSHLANGIYIYVLQTGGTTIAKKMVLLK